MISLIDDIITTLQDDRSSRIDDALRNTGFLFEKAHGAGAHLSATEQANQFAWTPEVIACPISASDVVRLRDALLTFLRIRPPTTALVAALWALSKLAHTTTKPILIQTLHDVVDAAPEPLFQAMIALANIGEDVFGSHQSMSVLAVEENRTLAAAYLQRQESLDR